MRRRINPEKTREAVLDAALDLFAQRGFVGTSINDIGDQAGVTKSLVLYHFGSKEALWQECFYSQAEPLIQKMAQFLEEDTDLEVRDMLRYRYEFLREHPRVARMLTWISLESAPLPERLLGFVPRILRKVLEELGHSPGQVTDPLMRTAIILGAMDGWFQNRPLYRAIAGIGEGEDADARFLEELLRLLPEGAK